MIHAAAARQRQAADPARSTWLSANAGSGKTRVLTDRVARLLLEGVDPQRILCLTYTKAAAAEMQNRLFRRLGKWAMLADDVLDGQLAELGIGAAGAGVDDATRRKARRLFARAIEAPGGLKIQTIHSFCASLLRRFPLEAGVTPQFVEIDERSARLLREAVVEDIAASARAGAVEALARQWTGEDFAGLTEEIARHRADFAHPLDKAAARRFFGAPAGAEALLAEVFEGGEADLVAGLLPFLRAGGARDIDAAEALAPLRLDRPDLAVLEGLERVLLYRTGDKAFTPKLGAFPGKPVQKRFPDMPALEGLMERVAAARPARLALLAAARTAALHGFAALFLPEYEARKAARGWLDFDDLIRRAARLLTDPSVAQWVLYRLDGGIDHILVDEAQDTSPEQWRVIELLAQEFSAGQGARDVARTLFVVGDKKQSIYSFQGADLTVFEGMKAEFAARLSRVGVALQDLTLDHSFRSAPSVLAAVDRTLADQPGLGGAPGHLAYWEDLPGRVDLWPLVEKAGPDPEAEWFEAVDHVGSQHPDARLADALAGELARLIAAGAPIPARDSRGAPAGARPMTAGDVLILVRRRSTLFHELIRACKQAGLPVAGADRLKLAGEMAIRDLGALLAFLVTPQDDLSLAGVLRSPLFGWSEDDLYRLAQPRPAELWEALRAAREAHGATLDILDDLRRQVDFLRPYEVIDRMLTFHGGRRRLIARLGEEAEDGIDALLAQALAYERLEVPSLSGFVSWLGSGEVEVKRQMDAAGGRLRVMTVHGAKGLEAPVVILPDSGPRRPRNGAQILLSDGVPVWAARAGAETARHEAARAALARAQAEEDRRLLYVAMTRAEDWLIVAGSGEETDEPCWHGLVAAGLHAAAAQGLPLEEREFPTGRGLSLHQGDWPVAAAGPAPAPPAPAPPLPPWALAPAPLPAEPSRPLSPSALGGAKALPGEATRAEPRDEEAARERGTRLHRLLEHLPLRAPAEWDRLGHDLLAADDPRPTEAEMAALLTEATAVLSAPALARFLGPDALAEVGISGPVAALGGRRILGAIDRLLIAPDGVRAVDFKSNAVVPDRPEAVPEGILRQMGAYRAALRDLYPGRPVEVAVFWTRAGLFMPLPGPLVAAALLRAGADLPPAPEGPLPDDPQAGRRG